MKQGRKRPLDTPKNDREKRERRREREREREVKGIESERDIQREGDIREIERDRKRERERERGVKGIESERESKILVKSSKP